jgi:hypothetical protein
MIKNRNDGPLNGPTSYQTATFLPDMVSQTAVKDYIISFTMTQYTADTVRLPTVPSIQTSKFENSERNAHSIVHYRLFRTHTRDLVTFGSQNMLS